MTELLSVSTVLPRHIVSAADAERDLATRFSASAAARFQRLLRAAGNETRHLALPFEQLAHLGTVGERTRLYEEHAVPLAAEAARRALDQAAVRPASVGTVVAVSSTGYLMPTLEARLVGRLGLPAHCRRIPLTQLGCAGGISAIALASVLAEAAPDHPVLVVCVELPSLCFPSAEPSASDVVASLQFGDGAGAAVLAGDARGRGPAVLGSASVLFPDTVENDGVSLTTDGLRLKRPRGLADILRRELGGIADEFLARHGLSRGEVAFWALQPRNRELLDAAAASLGLSRQALAPSRAVWRKCGNLISSAVFHVLAETRASDPPQLGAPGLIVTFGAGFACEMILLRAAGWLCGERTRASLPYPAAAGADLGASARS